MSVKIGDRAVYRPRVPYGRQSELFCFVTRVIDAAKEVVDLVAFPAAGEFLHINNVARMSETVQIHCWEPHVSADGDSADLFTMISELEARVAALENKRGGRASDELAKIKASPEKAA